MIDRHIEQLSLRERRRSSEAGIIRLKVIHEARLLRFTRRQPGLASDFVVRMTLLPPSFRDFYNGFFSSLIRTEARSKMVNHRLDSGFMTRHQRFIKRFRLIQRVANGQQALPHRIEHTGNDLDQPLSVARGLDHVETPQKIPQSKAVDRLGRPHASVLSKQPFVGHHMRPRPC